MKKYFFLIVLTTVMILSCAKDPEQTQDSNKSYITFDKQSYSIDYTGGNLSVNINSNIDYDIVIPEGATWIAKLPNSTPKSINFSIAKNAADTIRTIKISFNGKNDNVVQTLLITQFSELSNITAHNISVAGTLSSAFTAEQKDTIRSIKLTGYINDNDFASLRSEFPRMEILDLSDVSIMYNAIPAQALQGNQTLRVVSFPSSLETIGEKAFWKCSSLNTPNLKNLRTVGMAAFAECPAMQATLTIPISLTNIGVNAFAYSDGMDVIKILNPQPFTYNYHMLPTGVSVEVLESSFDLYAAANGWKTDHPLMTEKGQYASTNFANEGAVSQIYKSKTAKGADIVILGDGFVDQEMVAGGRFDFIAKQAIDGLFTIEPAKSYKDYFNVYTVKSISLNNSYNSNSSTAFNVKFAHGGETEIKGNDEKCAQYAIKSGVNHTTTLILVIVNSPRYGGTCYWYPNGVTVAYIPLNESFLNILNHEGIGHGFCKLLDEYIYHDSAITQSFISEIVNAQNSFNAGYNLTTDRNNVPWQHFIGKPGYDMVGLYEGGYFYSRGVWRAEHNQCMNDNVLYFNAPSREIFVKRVKTLTGQTYSFDEFLAKDKYEPVAAANATRGQQDLIPKTPLAPPVMVNRPILNGPYR